MMAALSGWLEKIILLVLLASFMDMLLPNSSTQRYVKLVMGLVILLALLTPVMQLFSKDLTPERLAVRMLNMNLDSSSGNMDQIKDYGEKLMQDNQKDTVQFVQGQLESLIKTKVEEDYGVSVKSIHVNLAKEKDKEQSYPAISSVQLVLDKDIKRNDGEKTQAAEIKPIAPVTIDVSGESPAKTTHSSTQPTISPENKKLLTRIRDQISSTWNIDRNRIDAKIEEKSGEGSYE
jgi:stage III sporulation protein AF